MIIPAILLDPRDGTNCRGCGMTARDCRAHEPGEVAAVCCHTCQHPGTTGNPCLTACHCLDEEDL